MTNILYYWHGSGIHVLHEDDADARKTLEGCLCVDPRYPDVYNRYGIFTNNGWTSVKPETLPAEFRAHLLLLGVS
jgi:hypothetical protein